ncbi:MAG: bifunctional methionine sulfoxide reductase B/A protein [Bdellovibrionota bacterium]
MEFKTLSLTKESLNIIQKKGTEIPFSGKLNDLKIAGTYLCRQCGLALFRSQTKFQSDCGWPSFDEEIANSIKRVTDSDGKRTEILCSRCDAHLGHVFSGEGYTPKNIRHCVNSLSLDFVSNNKVTDTQEAIFAAGCFWGVEYYFKKLPGVLKTEVGYTGGEKQNPTYDEVCKKNTGHFEALRVIFDPKIVTYEKVIKYFFEIHDPTQTDGQGPDLGPQYLSAIFYFNEEQKLTASKVMTILDNMDKKITTSLLPVKPFWPAENFHQNYYAKMHKMPYCHVYKKIFED